MPRGRRRRRARVWRRPMKRLLLLAFAAAAIAAGPAAAAGPDQSLPPTPLAGTHACKPAPFTRGLRVRGTTCHRARQVSHFWETHGRCVGGWSQKRYAVPAGGPPTGGSYLSCPRRRARGFLGRAGGEGKGGTAPGGAA